MTWSPSHISLNHFTTEAILIHGFLSLTNKLGTSTNRIYFSRRIQTFAIRKKKHFEILICFIYHLLVEPISGLLLWE